MWAVYAFLSLYSSLAASSSWTQQYGDHASSNYVDGPSRLPSRPEWNYTVPAEKKPGYNPISVFYNSPAVTKEGTIFIPYLKYPEYFLQIRAVSSSGRELWVAHSITANQSFDIFMCAVVFMTNALYSEEHNLVIVGWDCANAFPYYRKAGQVVALNASNGSVVWRAPSSKSVLKVNDVAKISMSSDMVYLTGGYDCYRDGIYQQKFTRLHANKSTSMQGNQSHIVAIDLRTGEVIWDQIVNHAGCVSQTKLAQLKDDSSLFVTAVNLPNGPYPAGNLVCFKCPKPPANCSLLWILQERLVTYDGKYAFTSDASIMYGSYGFAGNPHLIFALEASTGTLSFSNEGYCDPGSFPSGPAVDGQGIAYYSCGNRVFAVNVKGEMVWKSLRFETGGYEFSSVMKLSPAIHHKRSLIIFVDTECNNLYALYKGNGSLYGSIPINELRNNNCTEPPIVVGDVVYVTRALGFLFYYLFSIPLNKLIL